MQQQQGIYDNGSALPNIYRERILDLHHQGFSQRQISGTARVSIGYVNKVVQNYVDNNTSLPPTRKHKTLLITLNPRNCASPAHNHLNFNSAYCWMEFRHLIFCHLKVQ